jgi:hypothetical protein
MNCGELVVAALDDAPGLVVDGALGVAAGGVVVCASAPEIIRPLIAVVARKVFSMFALL